MRVRTGCTWMQWRSLFWLHKPRFISSSIGASENLPVASMNSVNQDFVFSHKPVLQCLSIASPPSAVKFKGSVANS